MQETFSKILDIAVRAPSGDNMQPWRFEIKGGQLYIYNIPEKDPTLFNFKQRAAFISHGALLENITLTAPTFGFNAAIEYFPQGEPNSTAKVMLTPAAVAEPALFRYIIQRHTNRRSYGNTPLNPEQKKLLTGLFRAPSPVSIGFIEQDGQKQAAAAAICQGDRMIFENKTIHDFLFSHIRWTDQEVAAKKDGFNLKSMELAPQQVVAFKFFRSWKVMKIFNAIGFPKLAVKSNFPLYSKSSALVALFVENDNPTTFIELGRLLQRFWLTATGLGLSMHPMTAVPLLMQRITENQAQDLEPYQVEIIKKSYKSLSEIFGEKDKIIGFLSRLGYAKPPSGLSEYLSPQIDIK